MSTVELIINLYQMKIIVETKIDGKTQTCWYDHQEFVAMKEFENAQEIEYWKWCATQPHLNSPMSRLISKLRLNQLEHGKDSTRFD
jgi:hypothetical protein